MVIEAAAEADLPSAVIYEGLVAGKVHYLELPGGVTLICFLSLMSFKEGRTQGATDLT